MIMDILESLDEKDWDRDPKQRKPLIYKELSLGRTRVPVRLGNGEWDETYCES